MSIVLLIFLASGALVFNLPAKVSPVVTPATPGQWWIALVFFLLSGAVIVSWFFSGGRTDSGPQYASIDEILRKQKGLDYWSLYDSRKSQPWPGNLYENNPVLEISDMIAAATLEEAAERNIHITSAVREHIKGKAREIAWRKVYRR